MIELRRYWFLIAVPVAVAFAFVTPPFQAPDEVGHYWYANAVARGELLPAIVHGKPTALVSRGVRDIVLVLWVPTAGHPDLKVGRRRIADAAKVGRGPDDVPVTFPGLYTPVPYAATAFASWIGVVFRLRPLIAFYLGRLLNAGAMILLTQLAIRRLPAAGGRFAAVALLPMTLYLAGSYSPDAVTSGLASYVTALAVSSSERRADLYLLAAASAFLALTKPVYVLPALVAIVIQRSWRRSSALVIAIAVALLISSFTVRRNYSPRQDTPTSPAEQLRRVLADPAGFVVLAAHDYRQHGLEYVEQLVGRLGWLDLPLPQTLVRITFVLLLTVGIAVPAGIPPWARITGIGIVIATCLLISLSQYLAWTAIGANAIDGIQGRYFLPLLPLALTVIGRRARSTPVQLLAEVLFAASAAVLNVIAVWAVVHRYY